MLTDLLDAILAAQQHRLGVEDDIVAYPVERTTMTHLRHDHSKILGRDAQLVGIERHLAVGHVILLHQLEECLENLLIARDFHFCLILVLLHDLAHPIGYHHLKATLHRLVLIAQLIVVDDIAQQLVAIDYLRHRGWGDMGDETIILDD